MPITVSGTAITFNDATTQTTAFTGAGGTVTSVATGNGLQGGTITTSGTLSVACPGFNTVGSYCFGILITNSSGTPSSNTNYSAGGGTGQVFSGYVQQNYDAGDVIELGGTVNLSGTWKWMGGTGTTRAGRPVTAVICRVS